MKEITYAKTGGPPDNWKGLRVLDCHGNEIKNVVEVNTLMGWVKRIAVGDDGNPRTSGDELVIEELTGQFTIVEDGAG